MADGLAAVTPAEQCRVVNETLNEYLTTDDVAGVIAHKVIEGGSDEEWGFGWLRLGSSPRQPKPVWTRFATRVSGSPPPAC